MYREMNFRNGVIVTRKESARKWVSETIFPQCFFGEDEE